MPTQLLMGFLARDGQTSIVTSLTLETITTVETLKAALLLRFGATPYILKPETKLLGSILPFSKSPGLLTGQ